MAMEYVPASPENLAYWRVFDNPGPEDIDSVLQFSLYLEDYRILIHGRPCNPSPEWGERHPGEAAAGEATYPFNVSLDSISYSNEIVQTFEKVMGLRPGSYTQQQYARLEDYEEILRDDATFITNFANVLILATEEDCWEDVEWIDFIDMDSVKPVPPPPPPSPPIIKALSPKKKRDLAKKIVGNKRKRPY